jgi:DNA ligase-associated metallophosphoesterase
MSGSAIFDFAGERFHMLADRALFWPAQSALIVADLHFEKASWYAAHGQPLPPYDSQDTLDRLALLATATGAREIWCLGDSFHDRDAATRIAPAIAARLAGQAAATRIVWIAGNHDGLTAGAWGGDVVDEMLAGGIVFRHQSLTHETRPEISGHFHPKLRLNVRGRHVSRPCFASDGQRLILPAFGSFTGGLDVEDAAIAVNFSGPYRAMLAARGRLLSIPCAISAGNDATASRIAAGALRR